MLLAVHNDREPLKGALLAEWLGTTTFYLPQVMKPLVSSGWVKSEPGPTGGYRAAANAAEVSMFELIEAVEGPLLDGRCVLKNKPCPEEEHCALHEAWSEAREALITVLQKTQAVDGTNPNSASSRLKGDIQWED